MLSKKTLGIELKDDATVTGGIDHWSPVNKIDNLNRDFFVLCHD